VIFSPFIDHIMYLKLVVIITNNSHNILDLKHIRQFFAVKNLKISKSRCQKP